MEKGSDIVSAKVIGIKKQKFICETESKEILVIKRPLKLKSDKIFTQIMFDILQNELWIPVNRKLRRFIKYDWLDISVKQFAF
ncbi:hypothetical protein [Liquorilactobacillus oeni]|nr:hypothetical protein [Liquorilactobacillus oeni]